MTLHSAIYEGFVRHRRMQPARHEFRFPLFMVYLDLAELDRVFSMTRWWSAARIAPARFRRRDYLGDPAVALDTAVRDRVEAELGFRPDGPIRLLTHLRYFGCCFNPVSFYYCYDAADQQVSVIVAEITNTPWGERHAYVLDRRVARENKALLRWSFDKDFHVSPFMPMEIDYDWAFSTPDDALFIHMNLTPMPNGQPDSTVATPNPPEKVFDATLELTRRELTPARMRAQLIRFPFMTARVIARIHFEALRLWLKRVPVHAHPRNRAISPEAKSPQSTTISHGVAR